MCCGLILAGGDSTRMGEEKQSLKITQQGMVEMVADALVTAGCEPLLIATRDGNPWPGWRAVGGLGEDRGRITETDNGRVAIFVTDEEGWVGPQAGLVSGLNAAIELGYEWVQLAPCDVPLLNSDLLLMLQEEIDPKIGALVPEGPDGSQPLLALVQPKLMLNALYRARGAEKRSIFAVLESMVVKVISHPEIKGLGIDNSCFLNVNSPEDLQIARNLLNR